MILLIALLSGCSSVCLGRDCAVLPDIPWDPGDGLGGGDEYGYGGGEGEGGTEVTEEEGTKEVLITRSCDVVLRHKPAGNPSTVEVAGAFNDWTPAPLDGPDADGFFSASLGALAPGSYAHKLLYDGTFESGPPVNVYTQWAGGSEHRSLRVGDCNRPLLQAVSSQATAEGTLTATVQFATAADGAPVDPAAVRVTVGSTDVPAQVDPVTGLLTVDVTGLPPGKHSVRVWASDDQGRTAENEPLFVPLWVEDEPFQWEDGLLYFVFTDRFRNGDWDAELYDPIQGVAECANYQGGDFLGVIHALEEGYFAELGVNALWLSPVYENPEGHYGGTDGNRYTGYHGYWPTSPLGIESRFGDAGADGSARLDELIEVAHSQGIRVLFDLVLNHVHEDHAYVTARPEWFGTGCVCGTAGCGWDDKPIECWFTDYLPDLDYKNHAITEQVLADTLRLVELHDVDAVRVDAAKHMDHVIMRSLRKRLDEEVEAGGGAPVYMVGETYTFTDGHGLIMDYVGDHELDGQFDFPLYYAIRDTFVHDRSFRDLEAMVATGEAAYGDALMSPFLGNHDVSRFASEVTGQVGDFWNGQRLDPMAAGGNQVTQHDVIGRMSMGFAFTLTQPGVPLLYYGDEIGLHGGGDPDNRRLMNFDPFLSANQLALRSRVRAIGRARADHIALRRGERVQLWVDDDLLVYALDHGGGDVAIVAMNKGWGDRTESISVAGLGIDGAVLTDAVGTRSLTVSNNALPVSLGSWEYLLLVRP